MTKKIHTPENIEKVAAEFVKVLSSKDYFDRPVHKYHVENANDYFDANMAMEEAFKKFHLDPLAPEDGEEEGISQDSTDLWNAAWAKAIEDTPAADISLAKNGARAKLKYTIDCYTTGIFESGLTGTIEQVDLEGDIIAMFRLDTYNADLDEWDNCLQIGKNDQEFICDISFFEVIP